MLGEGFFGLPFTNSRSQAKGTRGAPQPYLPNRRPPPTLLEKAGEKMGKVA
jgi:hypothetical protein